MVSRATIFSAIGLVTLPIGLAHAATLEVGPSKAYATPCAAAAAAADGDTIEIDPAGSYDGDVCTWTANGLTIRGAGGRARIDAAGQSAQGKAIWVIAGNDTTIENIELSGAKVVDLNGAGIRQEGANLTVRNSWFHDDEDGILAGDNPGSEILVESCEFSDNGAGDGYSHNMYINHVAKFTLRGSYSHAAKVGHLVKSRAAETHLEYNRLSDEDGTASYEIDLPNGGLAFVIGNVVEQGPNTQNGVVLAFGEEGAMNGSALFVVNDTFVNDRMQGGTFVSVGDTVTTPVVLRNSAFVGSGTLSNQASAVVDHVFTMGDPMLANVAGYDYHPLPGSPLVDAGVDPGMGGGASLAPSRQYVHPASTEARTVAGAAIDVGAFELGGGGGAGGGGAGGDPSGSTSSDASSGDAGVGGGAPADAPGDEAGCGCRSAPGGGRLAPFAFALAVALIVRRRALGDRSARRPR